MRHEKTNLLKFIDHWIGSPACIVLALLNRLFHPFYQRHLVIPSQSLPPRNILVIKFFGLGSITLASALISNIRHSYKDARIIFLTFKENVPMLQTLSLADEILVVSTENPYKLLQSIWRVILYCHRQRIDISMDIEFYSKFSTIMSFLSGAEYRMGFYLARFWRDSLVNVPVYFNYSRHILEIYGMFAASLGVKSQELYPKGIKISEGQRNGLRSFLQGKGINDLENTIAINIHASDLALCRRWPLPKFVTLVQQILTEYPQSQIILTGLKAEKSYAEDFLSLLPSQWHARVVDLTGEVSLDQFLILLSLVPLFITNDTGPFHLAKALGTRTISLWGPGSVDLYGPYGQENEKHDVIYKRYACSPCLYVYRTDAGYFCKGKAPCMEDIDPSDVMGLVRKRFHAAHA